MFMLIIEFTVNLSKVVCYIMGSYLIIYSAAGSADLTSVLLYFFKNIATTIQKLAIYCLLSLVF